MDDPRIGTALTNLPAGILLSVEPCGCMWHDGCKVIACLTHEREDIARFVTDSSIRCPLTSVAGPAAGLTDRGSVVPAWSGGTGQLFPQPEQL